MTLLAINSFVKLAQPICEVLIHAISAFLEFETKNTDLPDELFRYQQLY